MSTTSTNDHLRLISGEEELTLEPSNGTYTIYRAKSVFVRQHGIFRRFDDRDSSTKITFVQVYDVVKGETLDQIYRDPKGLDALCFTQSQIINFVKKYPNWLYNGSGGTLFLIKARGAYYVVSVQKDIGRFSITLVDSAQVFLAEDHHYRVVLPHQAA